MMAAMVIFATSCDLDLLDDPNNVNASNADPSLILNSVQLGYQGVFNTVGDDGMRLTRMINQGAAQYEGAYTPTTTNGYWSGAYSGILADVELVLSLAEEGNLQRHAGMAKTIKAMVYFHLVDSYGDVPFTEAIDANNFFPNVDPGAQVYDGALALLNEAEAHFTTDDSAGFPNDYYYGGDWDKWVKLVNTLKLRYYLNRRLIDPSGSASGINALIASGNLIDEGDDFVFQFSTTNADPDSRHPRFTGTYINGGGDYQSTYYMWHLTEAKGFDDPRVRYYMYRQTTVNSTDADEIECIDQFPPSHYLVGGFIFCLPGERGYWGRDHLNPDGIPPDGLRRTVWGVYPAGGRFDDDSAAPVNDITLGAQGAGFHPIMMASYVDFMLAEAALFLGTTGDAAAYLESGIQKSMNHVRSYSMGTAESGAINDFQSANGYESAVGNYVSYIQDEYSSAASDTDKMRIIGREYWLALYGNGVEAFNLYRRTGQPDNMQPGLQENFGDFPRSFFYPLNYLTTNNNAVQKPDQTVQVFWDNNPSGNGWVY